MIWYKYISINVLKIYKYIYKFKWIVKKHSWNKFLNNIKNIFYINNNIKNYQMQFLKNKVIYFFFNYNVNFRIRKGKMKFLIFIKKKIFVPILRNLARVSSYLVSLNYKKNFYRQTLYWYYNLVRPIKFNYNYNDIFKYFNSIINIIDFYFIYLELLVKNSFLTCIFRNKIFYKIKKLFNKIIVQCLKVFKKVKNIKYFTFSFIIKRRYKNKKLRLKKSYFFVKKKLNIILLLNSILMTFLLFLIKNWLDLNFGFLTKNFIRFVFLKNEYILNKRIYNFLYIKYRIAWKLLYKITYVDYFKPIYFIINYKKYNYF